MLYLVLMIDENAIARRYEAVRDRLDERGRRLFAATEARIAGHGGIAAVCRATEVARSTIGRGLKDLDGADPAPGRVRRAGGGRRPLTAQDPSMLDDLRDLVEPVTLGDPVRPLRWVSKSQAKLAAALRAMGHPVAANTVREAAAATGIQPPGQPQGQ